MAHIIIFDEFGNEIGREEHDPGGGFAPEPEHEPTRIVVNIGKIITARGIKTKDKPRLEKGE